MMYVWVRKLSLICMHWRYLIGVSLLDVFVKLFYTVCLQIQFKKIKVWYFEPSMICYVCAFLCCQFVY